MSIRTRVFLILLGLSVIGGGIGFSASSHFVRTRVTDLIGEHAHELARNNIDAIDRIIHRRVERWQSYVIGRSSLVTALGQEKLAASVRTDPYQAVRLRDGEWKQAIADRRETPFMRSVVQSGLSEELRERISFYSDQYQYVVFPEVLITNAFGAVFAANTTTAEYDQSQKEWWKRARDENVYVGDAAYDPDSHIFGIPIAIRIEDHQRQFLGVLKVTYDIQDIFASMDVGWAAKEGGHNIVVTAPGNGYALRLLTKDGKLLFDGSKGVYGYFTDKKGLLDKLPEGKGFYIDTEDGAEKMFSVAQSTGYRNFKGLGWSIVASRETRFALKPLVDFEQLMLSIAALSIFLVLLVGFAITRIFTEPVKRLHAGIKIIEEGNLDYKVGTAARDEIGELSRSFDDMTSAFKQSRQGVDAKVKEQTKELQEKAEQLAKQQQALVNVLQDVNEERDRVAVERDKTNIILQSIGDGAFVTDEHLRISMFNGVAEQISGYAREEVYGKPYEQVMRLVSEIDGKPSGGFIAEVVKKGVIRNMADHTVLIRKDGTKVPVADSAAPLRDGTGRVTGCVVVFRDVTREREIDQAKTEFVSVASHQLRTPLTGIKWFCELLQKMKLDATVKEYIEQIRISNERMVSLVNDLLNVSRIDTGRKFDLLFQPTDIIPLVQDVLKEQSPMAAEKRVALECHEKMPRKLIVPIDELKIRQVLQNLISNSIKYSREKTQIVVGCDQGEKEVTFSIQDQGIGIPRAQQGRIFEKFFRAENALTAHTDGTGLGLYIVKAIVEAHGGKVRFHSEEGVGTTFWFSLPLMRKQKTTSSREAKVARG